MKLERKEHKKNRNGVTFSMKDKLIGINILKFFNLHDIEFEVPEDILP